MASSAVESGIDRSVLLQSELQLLNKCLLDALSVHLLVSRSMVFSGEVGDDQSPHCTLLDEDVQLYLHQLLEKCMTTTALRRRLKSAKCMYFLQCLTDVKTREEFVRVAAHPSFADTSL